MLSGNFFDSAIMKMSVVGEAFRKTYLSEPGSENSFEARAIVFAGPEDYQARINDPALDIDERDLKKIQVPTLVMHGGDDQLVPYENSAPLAVKLLKNGTLKKYPGFPHGMPTTNAAEINSDILAFIRG